MNDLIRSPRAWVWIWTLSRLTGAHPMVQHDGPLSVRRAFRPYELEALAWQAGIPYLKVTKHFGYRQTLAGETANSIATDLGSLYRFGSMPLSLGLSVQNLGSQSKFKSESDPLPLTINLGSSYRLGQDWMISGVQGGNADLLKKGLLLSLDGHFPRDNDASMRLGMEFTHGWSENVAASVRGGYQSGRSRQIDSSLSGVSAGAGINYRFFSFDFAWEPFGNLGNTFRYSVKLRF